MEIGDRVKVTLWKGKPGARVVIEEGEVVEIYPCPDHEGSENEECYVLHVVETKDSEGNRVSCGTYYAYEVEPVDHG